MPRRLGKLEPVLPPGPGTFRGTGGWYSHPYKLTLRKGVRTIKKKEEMGIKRVNINIPTELHNRFKASTAAQGLEMTVVLMAFIEGYVAKHGPAPQKKGRRA